MVSPTLPAGPKGHFLLGSLVRHSSNPIYIDTLENPPWFGFSAPQEGSWMLVPVRYGVLQGY
ncbi:MAG: hypothetical protein M1389_08330, partial [Chloroflexi bacterium]|nr:hypothetical protein [Chloroflexota bacterium]